jgi:hypothetical protein
MKISSSRKLAADDVITTKKGVERSNRLLKAAWQTAMDRAAGKLSALWTAQDGQEGLVSKIYSELTTHLAGRKQRLVYVSEYTRLKDLSKTFIPK